MTPPVSDALAGAHPGLRDVVEAVWHPGDSSRVQVRLGVGAGTASVVETYFVLPHPSRPRLLLPADDLVAARRALAAYRGLRSAPAEAWARVIRASVLSSGPASRALRRLHVHADAGARRLLPLLAAEIGASGRLRASLAVRRPGPYSKPTVGLFDDAGRPVAYAKLGRSPLTDAMVRHEAAVLRELSGRLRSITTPALLAEVDWYGHPVTVMAPLPGESRRLPTEPLQMADTLWEIAASGEFGDHELHESTYLHRLRERLQRGAATHPDLADLLRQWCDRLSASGPLRFGRSHGDWVSWNLGVDGGKVVVWDWELSVPDAPVGFDACHWYFQRAQLHGGVSAAAAAVREMAPGLAKVGVGADDAETVADLYLLDRCVGGIEAAAATGMGDDLAAFGQLARRRLAG